MGAARGTRSTVRSAGGWLIETRRATAARGRAGRRAAGGDPFVEKLLGTRALALASEHEATLPARRGVEDQPLVFDFTPPDDAAYVVVARHASGAISFAFGERLAGRRPGRARAGAERAGAAAGRTLRFRISTRSTAPAAGRRGVAGKVIRFFVTRVVNALADAAIPKLAALWEGHVWKRRGLPRGLLQVGPGTGGAARLAPIADPRALSAGRNLLFLHGTFSDFQGAFADLLRTPGAGGRTFFEQVRDRYGERIFAFNHLSVSQTPVENARDLLQALPDGAGPFDVVTHSRGALVLRSLLERSDLGPGADRFRPGNAVLVAGPNQGTPLASPERWETLTSWLANLIDLFPENPFTVGLDFVVEAVAWLAAKVGDVIPGLAAMNPGGPFIRELQGAPAPAGTFSALVASYEPDAGVLARLADLGADGFFGAANDLVVPTAGGWRVDAPPGQVIPGERVGCFGPGGNLRVGGPAEVHHLNFFRQPESVDFLGRAVRGEPQGLPVLDVAEEPRPGRRGRPAALAGAAPARLPPAAEGATAPAAHPGRRSDLDEVFHLLIVSPDDAARAAEGAGEGEGDDVAAARAAARSAGASTALLIASFRNARVIEPFRTSQGPAGQRFKRIIAVHERIKGYVDGKASVRSLPSEEELRSYGALLFSTLFPGQVRRLYDSARSELKDRRLNVCLTSTIGWVADKPWEFAFDRSRQTFICTEEVNFIRNSLTAVPADALAPRGDRLRILVVAAQPIGAGELSSADEEEKIRGAFAPLVQAGLAEVRVEVKVTPQKLHELLTVADVSQQPYDVLHFIGHGEYDAASGFGFLLFEDAEGRSQEMRADTFRQIVARREIRLVFLNACETGLGLGSRSRPGRAFDFSRGVAPMLVSGGVPTIVANQFKVLDVAATAFAAHFYWALAVGRTIGDAAREARVAVNYSIAGEAIDWAVPVLFARNPDDVLVTQVADPAAVPFALAPGTSERRRAARRDERARVAIWDVNYVVPQLGRIVARLNEVQAAFAFETAELAAPLGTWRRSVGDGEARTYLYAKEVERKLRPTLSSLGVTHLCCVTSMPLSDGRTMDLSAHATDDGAISIVSTNELLRQLRPPELSLERLVANFLAFVLSGLTEHKGGTRSCPVYYNDERDIRWHAGPLAFCRPCWRKLPPGERREALKALLGAF